MKDSLMLKVSLILVNLFVVQCFAMEVAVKQHCTIRSTVDNECIKFPLTVASHCKTLQNLLIDFEDQSIAEQEIPVPLSCDTLNRVKQLLELYVGSTNSDEFTNNVSEVWGSYSLLTLVQVIAALNYLDGAPVLFRACIAHFAHLLDETKGYFEKSFITALGLMKMIQTLEEYLPQELQTIFNEILLLKYGYLSNFKRVVHSFPFPDVGADSPDSIIRGTFNCTGRFLFLSRLNAGSIRSSRSYGVLYDLTQNPLEEIGKFLHVRPRFSPDGKYFVTSQEFASDAEEKSLLLFELETKRQRLFPYSNNDGHWEFSADSAILYIGRVPYSVQTGLRLDGLKSTAIATRHLGIANVLNQNGYEKSAIARICSQVPAEYRGEFMETVLCGHYLAVCDVKPDTQTRVFKLFDISTPSKIKECYSCENVTFFYKKLVKGDTAIVLCLCSEGNIDRTVFLNLKDLSSSTLNIPRTARHHENDDSTKVTAYELGKLEMHAYIQSLNEFVVLDIPCDFIGDLQGLFGNFDDEFMLIYGLHGSQKFIEISHLPLALLKKCSLSQLIMLTIAQKDPKVLENEQVRSLMLQLDPLLKLWYTPANGF